MPDGPPKSSTLAIGPLVLLATTLTAILVPGKKLLPSVGLVIETAGGVRIGIPSVKDGGASASELPQAKFGALVNAKERVVLAAPRMVVTWSHRWLEGSPFTTT